MNEKEKEALKLVKEDFEAFKKKNLVKRFSKHTKAMETVLNLIDKQQKEIELSAKTYERALDMLVDKDYKIKAKMQEIISYTYNSEEEKLRQEYAYDRLKELLGEEDE